MQKITILGLAVAISMMSCTVSVAEAEPIPSPYRQARDGVPIGEIVCAGDRMLMLSPSGMPACVFAESVEVLERRGFVPLSEMPRDDLSSKQPASEKAEETGSPDASKTGDMPFVTTWRTTSLYESITIPVGNATGAYTVSWGDGSISANVTGDQKHTYHYGKTYTVRITGNFERIYLNNHTTNAPKLQSIEQWGDVSWTSMGSAFHGASSMIYNADDVPDLSGVTDMSGMFRDASKFNGDVSKWDVSHVTDMSDMFHGAITFSRNLSEWDVSNVTDMSGMFTGGLVDAASGGGGVSSAPSLPFYPYNASRFNGDISTWDVSKVTNMSDMFHYANNFNGDLYSWDVSSVTDMSGMFHGAFSFRGNISEWDVSSVTDMSRMLDGVRYFNSDLSSWDVSGVTDMSRMFVSAKSFNGNISEWDVSSVTDMSLMFANARSFNGDISPWDVSGVTDMSRMFYSAASFNQPLSGWDVSGVTDMSRMFDYATSFNGNLSSWDVSSVTDMSGMFWSASSFSQNLGNWYVVLDGTSIDIDSGAKKIGSIAAQNPFLDGQNPTYRIRSGADSTLFAIDGDALMIKPSVDYSGKAEYAINITSTGDFGKNNFRVIDVTVTGASNTELP